nr:hypothetical protein Iba_chr01aCG17280 [Ipomoea batatas]
MTEEVKSSVAFLEKMVDFAAMTLADLELANLKINISTKRDGKRDDREKGWKMVRNLLTDNKKLESKKCGSDDDFVEFSFDEYLAKDGVEASFKLDVL